MSHPAFGLLPPLTKVRGRGSRGDVNMLAAVSICIGVLLMAAVLEYGFLLVQKQGVTQTDDALATAWGLEAIHRPMSQWGMPYFANNEIKQANVRDADTAAGNMVQAPFFDPGRVFSDARNDMYLDAWVPVFVQVKSSLAARDNTAIGRIVTGGGTLGLSTVLPTLYGDSMVRISQFQVTRPTYRPERVVLLLDFSRTMSLNYTGGGTGNGLPAYQILQNAANEIVNKYGSVINLGVICFSDGTRADPSQGLLTNNQLTRKNASSNQLTGVIGTVNKAAPTGDGTDLAKAISDARTMLANANGSVTDPLGSNARIIMITDGEPDKMGGTTAGASGSREDDIIAYRNETSRQMQMTLGNSSLGNAGMTSDIFYIQREGEGKDDTIGGVTTQDFLRSLSGTATNVGDANSFLSDGGDPGAIDRFIAERLRPMPSCYMQAFEGVTNLLPFGPAQIRNILPQVNVNGTVEPMTLFLAYDATNRPTVEFEMKLFVDNLAAFAQEQAGYGAIPMGTNAGFPSDYFSTPTNQRAAIAHYDSRSHIIRIDGVLCQALSDPTNLADHHLRIRARFGQPRAVPSSCQGNSSGYACSF